MRTSIPERPPHSQYDTSPSARSTGLARTPRALLSSNIGYYRLGDRQRHVTFCARAKKIWGFLGLRDELVPKRPANPVGSNPVDACVIFVCAQRSLQTSSPDAELDVMAVEALMEQPYERQVTP